MSLTMQEICWRFLDLGSRRQRWSVLQETTLAEDQLWFCPCVCVPRQRVRTDVCVHLELVLGMHV